MNASSEPAIRTPLSILYEDFQATSALLRLATIYEMHNLRAEVIQKLTQTWPASLPQWEIREKNAVNEEGLYTPRPTLPHPMYVFWVFQHFILYDVLNLYLI